MPPAPAANRTPSGLLDVNSLVICGTSASSIDNISGLAPIFFSSESLPRQYTGRLDNLEPSQRRPSSLRVVPDDSDHLVTLGNGRFGKVLSDLTASAESDKLHVAYECGSYDELIYVNE